ncbi:hypothetical protein IE077_002492 [Cardiosporidium cionae]|uniref:Nuclear pore complex protein Nup85 n=1 Tax=Cardiosporidium cionae TaxID=476202 RepID=A0ABQ7JAQ7_9APIC|nr:hypothetical protein IE077_002492 [Cardiosporidium cionae]|eukprot:KAF8821076.1 hypothetical protein IE077_002492 [Cardiosporidium cionae]
MEDDTLPREATRDSLTSDSAIRRFSKALAAFKSEGLFDPPAYLDSSKSELGPDPVLWNNLRVKYERLAGTLVDDSIADKFRVATCRAFDSDHIEWEKEKQLFLRKFHAHTRKLQALGSDHISSSSPVALHSGREANSFRGIDKLSYLPSNEEELRFLQWLYEGAPSSFSMNFPALLEIPESSLCLPELKDAWKLIYIFGKFIRDKEGVSKWILKVISLLEQQSANLQQETLQQLKDSSTVPGTAFFEGIERIIAYVELSHYNQSNRHSPHWYWLLAYTAFRCRDSLALCELSGVIRSPIFQLENAPAEFSNVCKALAFRLYDSTMGISDDSDKIRSFPSQLMDETVVGDLVLSDLSLHFKASDVALDPYLRLLLSLISPAIWAPINISQVSDISTQEDYMWYKLRLILLYAGVYSNDEFLLEQLQCLAAKVRDLGAEYFGSQRNSELEVGAYNKMKPLEIGYSRMLMYSGCFGEAIQWLQDFNTPLRRVAVLFMIYLVNSEIANPSYRKFDSLPYQSHIEILEKMFVYGLHRAKIPLKFLFLKTIPKNARFQIFQAFLAEDFDELCSDDILGKITVEGKIIPGKLADMVLDGNDQHTSEAILHAMYETIGVHALQKNFLDVAFRCFFFTEDECRCMDVLERIFTERNFDCFKKVTVQDQSMQELFLAYYDAAASKWTSYRMQQLAVPYDHAFLFFLINSGKYLRAIDWIYKHEMIPFIDTRPSSEEARALTKIIICYAFCLSQLDSRGDFQVMQRYVSTKQLEALLQYCQNLYPIDPTRLSQASAIFREFLDGLTTNITSVNPY